MLLKDLQSIVPLKDIEKEKLPVQGTEPILFVRKIFFSSPLDKSNDMEYIILCKRLRKGKIMQDKTKNNRVTGAVIAEYLGVTPATVSRALAGNPRISAAMQKKVRDAARELGYISNATARTLVKGHSNIVGILTGGLHVERTALELIALDAELRKQGLLPCILYTKSETGGIIEGARTLIERDADGLLIIGCSAGTIHEWRYESLSRLIPTVFVDTPLVKHDVSMVCNDYMPAYEKAGDILAAKKRTHIHALMKRTKNCSVPGLRNSRFDGVMELLRRFNCETNLHFLPAHSHSLLSTSAGLNKNYTAAVEEILQQDPQCDALICSDDDIAVCAMGIFREKGKKLPEDISLLGFSNIKLCELFTPQLSSVAQQPHLVAEAAVRTLLELIKDPGKAPVHLQIPGILADRETL